MSMNMPEFLFYSTSFLLEWFLVPIGSSSNRLKFQLYSPLLVDLDIPIFYQTVSSTSIYLTDDRHVWILIPEMAPWTANDKAIQIQENNSPYLIVLQQNNGYTTSFLYHQ